MKEYNPMDQNSIEKCKWKAYQQFIAFLYMENADKMKYGSLLTGLQTQISLGNNQYPQSIIEANNVLSNHRFDNGNRAKHHAIKKENINENSTEESPEMSFSQLEGKCYCCGKVGHKSPNCRWKDKPKNEWVINKLRNQQQQQQSHLSTNTSSHQSNRSQSQATSTASTATSSVMSAWSGANVQFYQSINMKNIILLDNQSTVSLFCNKNLVEKVRKVDEQLELATNGGQLRTNLKATVPGYGEVWFHPKAITNIFSFAEMEDKHDITYNSKSEHAFIVHLPDKKVKFKRSSNGLYYYNPPYSTKQQTCATNIPIDSVEENMKMFTNRQVERAKLTRKIYHTLGTPSVHDFKMIVTTNAIKNLPITLEDIKTSEMIFVPWFFKREECEKKAVTGGIKLYRNPPKGINQ